MQIQNIKQICNKEVSYEDILDYLSTTMLEKELLQLWNGWFSEKDWDRMIHDNDESFLEQYFESMKDVLRASQYGEYYCDDSYVIINAYGNLETFDYINDSNSPYSNEEMADIIYNNQELFGQLLDDIKESLVTV